MDELMKNFGRNVLIVFAVVLFFLWLIPDGDSGQRCDSNDGTIYGACN